MLLFLKGSPAHVGSSGLHGFDCPAESLRIKVSQPELVSRYSFGTGAAELPRGYSLPRPLEAWRHACPFHGFPLGLDGCGLWRLCPKAIGGCSGVCTWRLWDGKSLKATGSVVPGWHAVA